MLETAQTQVRELAQNRLHVGGKGLYMCLYITDTNIYNIKYWKEKEGEHLRG